MTLLRNVLQRRPIKHPVKTALPSKRHLRLKMFMRVMVVTMGDDETQTAPETRTERLSQIERPVPVKDQDQGQGRRRDNRRE